jgi:hypothetical protein
VTCRIQRTISFIIADDIVFYQPLRLTMKRERIGFDRVPADQKHDWDRRGRRLCSKTRQRAAVGNDHRNLAAHQIGGERRSPLVAVRAGQPPRQRAIAQRFRALARMRPSAMSALTPLLGDKRTFR